jgi:cytochrome c1
LAWRGPGRGDDCGSEEASAAIQRRARSRTHVAWRGRARCGLRQPQRHPRRGAASMRRSAMRCLICLMTCRSTRRPSSGFSNPAGCITRSRACTPQPPDGDLACRKHRGDGPPSALRARSSGHLVLRRRVSGCRRSTLDTLCSHRRWAPRRRPVTRGVQPSLLRIAPDGSLRHCDGGRQRSATEPTPVSTLTRLSTTRSISWTGASAS